MKKMMICALLTVAVACCGTALYAQDNMSQSGGQMSQGGQMQHHMAMSPDQRLQHMTKTLNLNSDQQAKIKPMLEQEQQQMESLHQDTSMSQADKRSKMMQIRQGTNDQIKGVLTSDQQAKWEQMQERNMQRGMDHGGMGQGAGSGGGMGQSAPNPQ